MVSVDDADFMDERAMYENTDFCEPCGGAGGVSYKDEHGGIQWFVCGACCGNTYLEGESNGKRIENS